MNYSDIDSLKRYLGSNTTRDDELLDGLIASVSKQISVYCGREFDKNSYTEIFYLDEVIQPPIVVFLKNTPIISIDSITFDDVITTDMEYKFNKQSGRFHIINLGNYMLQNEIAITYTGGYSPIPEDIELATNLQCAFLYQRRDSVGTSSISSSDGNITTKVNFELIPGVKEILDFYRLRRA